MLTYLVMVDKIARDPAQCTHTTKLKVNLVWGCSWSHHARRPGHGNIRVKIRAMLGLQLDLLPP